MGFLRKKKSSNSPRLTNSELLHWKPGDLIESTDYGKVEKKNKFQTFLLRVDGILPTTKYNYKSITDDGFIIIEEQETLRLFKIELNEFLKDAKNISYNNRSISKDLVKSSRYMELIDEFQAAYLELQNADNYSTTQNFDEKTDK